MVSSVDSIYRYRAWKGVLRGALEASVLWGASILAPPALGAGGVDLHRLWEDRCGDCHGHAGDFARAFLSVSEAQLRGRHPYRDLRLFLGNHYLADSEVEAVYNMLFAQASLPGRFKGACGGCHGTAAKLVRDALELRGGALYGRNSGPSVRSFLQQHSPIGPDEVDFYMVLLTRVAHEIYRP